MQAVLKFDWRIAGVGICDGGFGELIKPELGFRLRFGERSDMNGQPKRGLKGGGWQN